MFFPFIDYFKVSIGSSVGYSLKYTTPNYKTMVSIEILSMERNDKTFSLYAPVAGDLTRANYFIDNQNKTIPNTTNLRVGAFGLTKILPANTQIIGDGDLSPFSAVLHIFRLPESV